MRLSFHYLNRVWKKGSILASNEGGGSLLVIGWIIAST